MLSANFVSLTFFVYLFFGKNSSEKRSDQSCKIGEPYTLTKWAQKILQDRPDGRETLKRPAATGPLI